jgi:hypothetical protein
VIAPAELCLRSVFRNLPEAVSNISIIAFIVYIDGRPLCLMEALTASSLMKAWAACPVF